MSKKWQPDKTDLLLATLIAIAYPFIARTLYNKTGALIPMLIYYGLAWGVFFWRRGETGYKKKFSNPPVWFYINLLFIIIAVVIGYFARIEHEQENNYGMFLTASIWAPINAASEQLLWIYIFESWDLYFPSEESKNTKGNKKKSIIGKTIGLILFSIFVGMIHTFFWVSFLHTIEPAQALGMIFVAITSITGFLHIIVWRQSKQMFYTFIPHFILNLIPTIYTGYSILPYLIS